MSVATAPVLSLAPTPEPVAPMFRLSVNQYHAIVTAGILTENDPVELLEGCLITKMAKNPSHARSTGYLFDALIRLLPLGWHLVVQDPITLADSEPEPDITIVRGSRDDYPGRHPEPNEIALVIEVADSSLSIDRKWKKRLYAAAGIPAYWVVNLPDKVIEVYTKPSGSAASAEYQHQQDYGLADTLPFILDDQPIGNLAVAQLLRSITLTRKKN